MKYYSKLIEFSEKKPLIILIIMTGVMFLEILYLKNNLKIDTDLKALFRGTNKTVLELEKIEERIGGYSTVLVVAHSPDREKNIKALNDVKKIIENNPLIRFVEFDRNVEYLEKNALLFASIEDLEKMRDEVKIRIQEKIKMELSFSNINDTVKKKHETPDSFSEKLDEIIPKVETYRNKYKINKYYEAENGTLVAMKVRPLGSETNIKDTKKIIDIVETAIVKTNPQSKGVTIEVGGNYRNKLREINTIYKDIFSTLAICLVLLSLAIIYYFRSTRALFIILLPLSAGILTSITLMQFFIGGFNIISAFSFTILYGLGIDFSIHIFGRFGEEKVKRTNCKEALTVSSDAVIPAILSGAVTTFAAFFSLSLIDFKGFSDFGQTAAIGIVSSFLSILIFSPAIIFVFDRIKPLNPNVRKLKILSFLFKILEKKSLYVCVILLILTIVSAFSIRYLSVEYNFDNLTFPDKYGLDSITNRYIQSSKINAKDFMSTGLLSFILTESVEETTDVSNVLNEIKKNNKTEINLKDYVSINTFLPFDQENKIKIIKETKRLIERKINLFDEKTVEKYNKNFKHYFEVNSPMNNDELPEWIKDKLSLKDGSYDKMIVVGLGGNKSNIEDVLKIKKEFGTLQGKIKSYNLLGSYMLLGEIKNSIDKHIPLAIVFSMVAVFAVLLIIYRSFFFSLVVFLPLVSGILIMLFSAALTETKLNIFNMVVIPLIIGTGIDSAIHIFHRYRKDGIKNLEENLINTGGTVFFSSLTTLIGFGSVAFASHKGLESIGIMASIGIITVTIVNLVFFPVLLKTADHFRKLL